MDASRSQILAVLVLVTALAANVLPSTLTLTTIYPAPSGVYKSLITTGGTTSSPVNTFLARDAGLVGIGTLTPQVSLHIKGTISTNTDIALESPDGYKWTMSSAAGTGAWILNRDIPGTLPVMNILHSGNIGIGTASPTQKLTVAGVMQTTTGGVQFPDGTIQTTAASTPWTIGGTAFIDGYYCLDLQYYGSHTNWFCTGIVY